MFLQRAFLTLSITLLAACTITMAADRPDIPEVFAPQPQQVSIAPNTGTGADYKILPPTRPATSRASYDCWLRVYITEPVSRFKDAATINYDFGFLDFGLDTALSLAYLETFQTTRVWHSPLGIGRVDSNNIMVMTAVFNQEGGGTNYSDTFPSHAYPFTIHTADGSAVATPGNPGWDTADGGYTHTVFLEKATWGA